MVSMTKISCTVAIGALALLCGAAAHSRQESQSKEAVGGSTEHSQTGMPRMRDKEFAKKAAQGGLAEVKMGQLAEQKGQSQTVKDFGKRMVDDHSKANDELKQAAAKSNITLPEQLDAKDQATYDQLSKLDGSAFDKTYARDMVKDHRADIAEFPQEARTGKDEPTKNFASQTVPTLETHLKMAREMMQSVSGGAGSRSGSSR